MRRFTLILATGFGSGFSPVAPGTAGTVVGIFGYLLFKDLSPLLYSVTIISFGFLAVWAATGAEREFGEKDCQKIVIDEIAGFLVTMAFVPFSWQAVVVGFMLFRLFDIRKPFPCRWVEKHLPSGWGIVGDDLVAGVYANLVLQALRALTLH